MEIAYADLGVEETRGPGATPRIVGYFQAVGRPEVASDEVSWCAAFVGACLQQAGVPLTINAADRLLARKYRSIGTKIAAPRVGAVAIFSRGTNPAHGHVGFVSGWTDTHIVLLGGNQSNKVSLAHMPRARLLELRWPAPAKTAKEVDAGGSRIAKAARRQMTDTGKAGLPQVIPSPPIETLPSPDALAGKATALQHTLEIAISFGSFVASKWPWIMAAITIYYGARLAYDAWRIRRWRAEDASTGKSSMTTPAATEVADEEIV